MTTAAKLRIDVSQGLIEAEGSESFLLELYNDFKQRLTTPLPKPSVTTPNAAAPAHAPAAPAVQQASRPKPSGSPSKPKKRAALTIVKDLNLSAGKNGRLKDFYEKFDLKTNFERNLVFVYFMQHEMEITGITDDHVFTCYRAVNAKLPTALRQSLLDTAHRNGWLDTSDMSDIRVATPGLNHLEHDLAKKAHDA